MLAETSTRTLGASMAHASLFHPLSAGPRTPARDPALDPGCAPARGQAHNSVHDGAPLLGASPDDLIAPAPAEKPPVSDVRTLHVLHILLEHTDEHHALSVTEIKHLLERVDGHEQLRTSRSSIRNSIRALRAAGIDINADNHTGYAIASRPIPDSEIELVINAIKRSGALTPTQRQRLTWRMLSLAGPTLRERMSGQALIPGVSRAPEPKGTYSLALIGAVELLQRAIDEELCIGFDLVDALPCAPAGTGGQEGTCDHPPALRPRRHVARFAPEHMRRANERIFVIGRTHDAFDNELGSPRSFALDRMENLVCLGPDGTIFSAQRHSCERPAPQD